MFHVYLEIKGGKLFNSQCPQIDKKKKAIEMDNFLETHVIDNLMHASSSLYSPQHCFCFFF